MLKSAMIWVISWFYRPHGGKWYRYEEEEPGGKGRMCDSCDGKRRHRRYMVGLEGPNKNMVLCIRCYFKEVPVEVAKIMLKVNRLSTVVALISIIIALSSSWLAFSHGKILISTKITARQTENIIEWAYSERSRNVARETIEKMVETVVSESPNLPFIVLTLAVLDTESGWDPGAIPKVVKNGRLVDGAARGPMQVLSSHADELKKAGILRRGDDPKALHNPITGVRAGIYYLYHYLEKAKGNTMLAMKFYLQGEGKKYENPAALDVYFKKTVNTMGEIMLVLDSTKSR